MPTTEELEERLNALEKKLTEQQRRRALKESLTCPHCDNTEIFHISELETYGLPLRIAHDGNFSVKAVGVVELYLCSQCGYGEVQIDPSQLKEKSRANVKLISRAKEKTEEEPYR
jgi:hypothetical protein